MRTTPPRPAAFLVALAVLLMASTAHAEHFAGQVVRVIDGDTFVVLSNGDQIRVRLADVDAPESDGQPFNEASRRSLAGFLAGRVVTVEVMDIDRFGRPVGRVNVDGKSVSREQVARGMAWAARRYNRDPVMPLLEARARASRVGLWSESNPVPPWAWRARSR